MTTNSDIEVEGTYLSVAAANHLRRLVAWVRCEVGQTPEELVDTIKHIAPFIGDIGECGKERLVLAHQQASAVPKYVRDAIKALEKSISGMPEEIDLSYYVNEADIRASDMPHTVVEKLQNTINRRNPITTNRALARRRKAK